MRFRLSTSLIVLAGIAFGVTTCALWPQPTAPSADGGNSGEATELPESRSDNAPRSVSSAATPLPPAGATEPEVTVDDMAERFAQEPALIDVLEDALHDPDPEVRRDAEDYLSRQ